MRKFLLYGVDNFHIGSVRFILTLPYWKPIYISTIAFKKISTSSNNYFSAGEILDLKNEDVLQIQKRRMGVKYRKRE